MASTATLYANLSASSSLRHSQGCDTRTKCKRNGLTSIAVKIRKAPSSLTVRSFLNSKESMINGNGTTDPARILLQTLFSQKQNLEEQIGRDAEFGLNVVKLESDLHAALLVLKKKEEDLQDAERKVLLEYIEISRARVELDNRVEEIAAANSKQEKLEDDLQQANLSLVSRAKEIEDLKFCLKDRDRDISTAQAALSLKEGELNKMKNSFMKLSEKAANTESELRSKARLLDGANEIINKQKAEIQDLRIEIQEKEKVLEYSLMVQKIEEDKLTVAEANLEKHTMNWLVTQEDLKKLAVTTSEHIGEENDTYDDFRRVKMLLADVRSELLSSRQALAISRQKVKDQERLLEQQLMELNELRRDLMSYKTLLDDTQTEMESEKRKLRLAESKKRELERDLSSERELVQDLQNELNIERSSLQESIEEMCTLQRELDLKRTEFEEVQNLLKVKESELVEARLEILHFKSEQASLQLKLQEKDLELLNTRKMFDELTVEITELRMLMKRKEDQLMQATTMLKEKDEEVLTMHHELNDAKIKISEAETAVECILELTNKLVISIKDDQCDLSTRLSDMHQKHLPQLLEKPANSFKCSKRHLKMTQESDDLKPLYGLMQGRNIGDLAVEKVQFESAQLEAEAATSALQMLTELSVSLMKGDIDGSALQGHHTFETNRIAVNKGECLAEVHSEVARLSALTDQLVQEAGIVGKVY